MLKQVTVTYAVSHGSMDSAHAHTLQTGAFCVLLYTFIIVYFKTIFASLCFTLFSMACLTVTFWFSVRHLTLNLIATCTFLRYLLESLQST